MQSIVDRNEALIGFQRKECRYVVWDHNRGWLPRWCKPEAAGCQVVKLVQQTLDIWSFYRKTAAEMEQFFVR